MKWKSLTVEERYEKYTRPYYFKKDDENQIQEFASDAEELSVVERNMDCVADHAYEKAELDEPPKELKNYFARVETMIKKRYGNNA